MNVANVVKELIEIYPKAEEILGSTLPDSLTIERLARIARSEFNKALNVNDFSPLTFLKAAITSINLDLEPEQGDTYLISCEQDIKTLISLKGINKLIHKSNRFYSFEVSEVWEKDTIEIIHGQNKTLIHKPYLRGDRGELIGFNCLVHSLERGHDFIFLNKFELDELRIKVKFNDIGLWSTHYIEMAKRLTAIRMLQCLSINFYNDTLGILLANEFEFLTPYIPYASKSDFDNHFCSEMGIYH